MEIPQLLNEVPVMGFVAAVANAIMSTSCFCLVTPHENDRPIIFMPSSSSLVRGFSEFSVLRFASSREEIELIAIISSTSLKVPSFCSLYRFDTIYSHRCFLESHHRSLTILFRS